MSKREEISDVVPPELFDDPKFKPGFVMVFAMATLKITKVDRLNKRVWAKHVNLIDSEIMDSHIGHDVDDSKAMTNKYGCPFCRSCNVPVSEKGGINYDNYSDKTKTKN